MQSDLANRLIKAKTIVFLMGPTASGKTDLAIKLANVLPVSIISVDSTLIYRGMDIGTAKPDKNTLKLYPHQLIDIRYPYQSYSVSDFMLDAKIAIKDAFLQKKIPLLVGGTGFYFRTLEYGMSKIPESDAITRKIIASELKEHGIEYLYNKLSKIDSNIVKKINSYDKQRIMRALEVFYVSGNTMSELQKQKAQGGLIDNDINYTLKKIILMPKRQELYDKIAKRFYVMIDLGLVDEVRKLYSSSKITRNMNSMRTVGYRQVWQYLASEVTKDDMLQLAIIATRQLCKRQSTWLKKEKNSFLLQYPEIDVLTNYLA